MGLGLKRAAQDLTERQAPLAGLVAAYIFALQMLNFPVAAGTSGHLLGGVLATVLVGPWAGAVCLAVVLFVQALLFADGGLTALGLNIFNISVVAGLGGYAMFVVIRSVAGRSKTAVTVAAGIAAGLSVPLSALAFVGQYALGGAGSVPMTTVAAAMVGVHLLIGIGEGVITALTIGAVLRLRPDLVYGAAPVQRQPAAV